MGVIQCKRIAKRRMSLTTPAAVSYVEQFEIDVSETTDNAPVVYFGALTASPNPLPAPYSVWSFDGQTDVGAFVKRIDLSQPNRSAPKRWIATVNYGQLKPNETPADVQENPFLRPVKYWLEERQERYPVEVDIDGKPIVNAAGRPFHTPVEQEETIVTLCAQRNMTIQEAIDINLDVVGRINGEPYRGAGEGVWKLRSLTTGQIMFENGISFYQGVYRLEHNKRGHQPPLVNQGFEYKDDSGKLVPARDTNGEPVTEPILLAADGKRLPDGEIGNTITPKTRDEYDFNLLGV